MGFFSWKTCDTERSVPNVYASGSDLGESRQAFTIYLLSPDGNHIQEDAYEGYGVIGGVDVFVWWGKQNHPEECEGLTDDEIRVKVFSFERSNGTNGGVTNCKFPIKIAEHPVDYDSVGESENCEFQGYFYNF